MDTSEKPSIVVVSSSSTKPKSLIKLITGASELDEDSTTNRVWHSWQIDTKYYTADIVIQGIPEDFTRTEEFNDTVEALVIHMDSNKDSGLQDLKTWAAIEEDCNPEVKLLICNYCTPETKITRAAATAWCLKRGFELIELYPPAKSSSDEDNEIIVEKIGVERVVEALQTHMWPNLVMKNASGKSKCDAEEKCASSNSTIETAPLDSTLFNDLLTEEGVDDFTELFSQLNMIKESIQSLPGSQRKQCAEQMVTAFWRAIGGDEEEIADI